MFGSTYKHPLVTLGDSLTLGFQSGAIYRTDINYPAIIAKSMGIKDRFSQPRFSHQAGLPINLEEILRGIEYEFGDQITWDESIKVVQYVYNTIQRIKHFWDVEYKKPILKDGQPIPFHNQSIFSATLNDALIMKDEDCEEAIQLLEKRGTLFDWIPHKSFYTCARTILNPTLEKETKNRTLLSNVESLSQDGGIEHLIVFLGANNLMSAITELKLNVANDDDVSKMPIDREATIYPPKIFRKMFLELADRISKLKVKWVYTSTLPDITEIPLLNRIELNDEVYYTHIWVQNKDFDPIIHPYLTEKDIQVLKTYVKAYNVIIKDVAKEYGWKVMKLDELVASLNKEKSNVQNLPKGLIRALKKNSKTAYLVDENDEVKLNTEFIQRDQNTGEMLAGGVFSLDGIHPTTIAYGLIASNMMHLMRENGYRFKKPIDWDWIVEVDSLVTNPPKLLNDLLFALSILSADYGSMFTKYGSNLFREIVEMLGGR